MATRDPERGSVLVLILLVAILLAGTGMSAMWLSSSSRRVSGNVVRHQEALHAAEVGIDRARRILNKTPNWDTLLGAAGGVPCSATAHHAVKGNVVCDANVPLENVQLIPTGSQTDVKMAAKPAENPPGYRNIKYTVYIRNDDVERTTGRVFDDQDRQVVLYAEGVARDGRTITGIEAVVAKVP